MNRIKPVSLLIILVFLVIPLLLLWLALSFKPKGEIVEIPTVPPTISPAPTLPPGTKTMKVFGSTPLQREDINYLPIQPIEITFTDSVAPESVKYTIDPYVEAVLEQGSISSAVIISPVASWKDGLTIITILNSTVSKNGARLSTPYIYEVRSSLPPEPEGDGNY